MWYDFKSDGVRLLASCENGNEDEAIKVRRNRRTEPLGSENNLTKLSQIQRLAQNGNVPSCRSSEGHERGKVIDLCLFHRRKELPGTRRIALIQSSVNKDNGTE
jgi:hypothetical protein